MVNNKLVNVQISNRDTGIQCLYKLIADLTRTLFGEWLN
jgi:hypothetical protein